jgi:hypothetical protein
MTSTPAPCEERWDYQFNNRRLLETTGNIPPVETEEILHANMNTLDMVAQ